MSQIESPVGVSLLREEIQKTYAGVAAADREFIFPTGRSWAQELGYPEPELARARRDGRELRRRGGPLAPREGRAPSCSTSAAAPAPTC